MKRFRDPVAPKDQMLLLPPSVDSFVPEDAPVRALSEIIDRLDCSALYERYRGGGAPAYEPRMLLKVLIFAYSLGIRSSRKIAQLLAYDLRFLFVSEMTRPDFRTLCRFRRGNLGAFTQCFKETVRLAQEMGLVLLEHTAVDGTKLEANAARRHIMNAQQIEKRLAAVEERIACILAEAEEADAAEDAQLGESRGDELPQELRTAQARKNRLEEAKEMLARKGGKNIVRTDPESRLMRTRAGWRAAYNGQAVVDSAHQIIVAADVIEEEADNAQLPPLLDQTRENCQKDPKVITADAGYWSVPTLYYLKDKELNAYIPNSSASRTSQGPKPAYTYDPDRDVLRLRTGEELYFNRERFHRGKWYRIYRKCRGGRKEIWVPLDYQGAAAMRAKLETPEGKALYRLRQQIVEPVFGQLKSALGLHRLLLRGLCGARTEYLLACAAHNLRKIRPAWGAA